MQDFLGRIELALIGRLGSDLVHTHILTTDVLKNEVAGRVALECESVVLGD